MGGHRGHCGHGWGCGGGSQYVGSKVIGGGGSRGGRGQDGLLTELTKRKTPGTEHKNRIQVANLTN